MLIKHVLLLFAVTCSVCLQVLEAQGHSLLSPSDRAGLHPLIIPLSTFEESAAGKQASTT
jgi:hypothetical protein